jgi:FKBP-type peptidyl-prolyl cis-trans isomerase 2
MAIKKDDWVKVSYTGKLNSGAVFDSSDNFIFQVGSGQVIKGFDDNITGMEEGAEKEFKIACADAYGEMSDERKETVPQSFFKGVEKVEVGMDFMAQTPMGPLKVKVLTIDGDNATVSLNHPLAGEDLTFSIKAEKVLPEDEAKAELEKIKKAHEEAMKAQLDAMKAAQGGAEGAPADCPPENCEGCSGCGPKDA